MAEDKINYSEIICEAVDTIVSKKLEDLEFDVTKTCRIIDDTHKKQGKYTVTDNSINFEAYSALTTLNINDNVLVNIPYGDYNNQKTILNKVVSEDKALPINYISPLDKMLKFTKNILTDQILQPNTTTTILANGNTKENKLYSFSWEQYSGYDRMGFSAKFLTYLGRYNTVKGTYGLKFKFISNDNNIYELDFNINDMIGNPYQFETYHKQEKLFDISKFLNINTLEIYLYQLGDFFDADGNYIPHEVEGDPVLNTPATEIADNIKIDDMEIILGYQLDQFNGDSLMISSPGYLFYSKMEEEANKNNYFKTLNLRWVHKEPDGSYSILTKNDITKRNIQVYWFKYALNTSEFDNIKELAGGPNWTRAGMSQDINDQFICTFTPDTNKAEEKIKVVCTIVEEGMVKQYSSSILTFQNEQAVVDSTTYDAATGFSIKCGDGTEGNYFIYNQSGEIINEGVGQGYTREFQLYYKGQRVNNSSIFKYITKITWRLPNKNTMLSYSQDYFEGSSKTDGDIITVIREKQDETNELIFTQSYSIKNYWHSSNSINAVNCIVEMNGNIYEISLNLNFGKAGTSGTNLTLVLDYANNNNAFRISSWNQNNICTIQASVYDMSGTKITEIEGTGHQWIWEWYQKPDNGKNFITLPIGVNSSSINLTLEENYGSFIEENYYVLQATYTRDDSAPITAYLPIGLMKDNYSYAEGARKIIYNSQGKPDYYTDAYVLYSNNEQAAVNWECNYPNYINHPTLKELTKNNKSYKALSANPVYIKDDDTRFCVYAKDQNNNVVYSQAILIMQSQYDYATLNNWNGSVDVGDRTIMTSMLGAGKKNIDDNTFSGIIIGDLQNSSEDNAQDSLGIYGINRGITTFSLLVDGNDSGCLMLGNPNGSLIQSNNGNFTFKIDEGFIDIQHTGSYESLKISDSPKSIKNNNGNYLLLTSISNNKILDFSQGFYQIKSDEGNLLIDLNSGSITSDANISTSKTISGGSLSISGKISGKNLSLTGDIDCNKITANSIVYKNQELSKYIQSLIEEAMKSS